jgi:hypothetical protein
MKRILLLPMLAGIAFAQTPQPCKVTFAVVRQYQDQAGDQQLGFNAKTRDWFQKKMAKKYPDVCYTEGDASVILFFSSTPSVFHGVRVVSSTSSSPVSGTVANNSGENVGTFNGSVESTSTAAVPYEVDYEKLHLAIEFKFSDGWKALEHFEAQTLHPNLYGICTRNCHPKNSIIEEAVRYMHESGLRTK